MCGNAEGIAGTDNLKCRKCSGFVRWPSAAFTMSGSSPKVRGPPRRYRTQPIGQVRHAPVMRNDTLSDELTAFCERFGGGALIVGHPARVADCISGKNGNELTSLRHAIVSCRGRLSASARATDGRAFESASVAVSIRRIRGCLSYAKLTHLATGRPNSFYGRSDERNDDEGGKETYRTDSRVGVRASGFSASGKGRERNLPDHLDARLKTRT